MDSVPVWSEASSQRIAHHERVIAATQELVRARLHDALYSTLAIPIRPLISLIAAYAVVPLTVTTIGGAGMNDLTTLHDRGRRADGTVPPPPVPKFEVAAVQVVALWKTQYTKYRAEVRAINSLTAIVGPNATDWGSTITEPPARGTGGWSDALEDEMRTCGGNRWVSYRVLFADGDTDSLCPERNLCPSAEVWSASVGSVVGPTLRMYAPAECVIWRPPRDGGGCVDASYLVYCDARERLIAAMSLRTFDTTVLASDQQLTGYHVTTAGAHSQHTDVDPTVVLPNDGPYGLCRDESTAIAYDLPLLCTSQYRNEIRRITLHTTATATAAPATDTGSSAVITARVEMLWCGAFDTTSLHRPQDHLYMRQLAGIITTTSAAAERWAYVARPDRFLIARLPLDPKRVAEPTLEPEVCVVCKRSVEIEKRIKRLKAEKAIEAPARPPRVLTAVSPQEVASLWRPVGLEWDRFTPEPNSVLFITAMNDLPLRRLVVATGEMTAIPIHVLTPTGTATAPATATTTTAVAPKKAHVPKQKQKVEAKTSGRKGLASSVSTLPELSIFRTVSIAANKLLVSGREIVPDTQADGVFVVDLTTQRAVRLAGCRLPSNRFGYANGTVAAGAEAASFRSPLGLAYDRNAAPDGTDAIYLCDYDNSALRCISGSIDWRIASASLSL